MLKQVLTASLCFWSCCAAARADATLTAREIRWLRAAGPVLAYSQRLQLPVDIIVQPNAGPGDVPMAMGFDGKRCKLVLSLRGNGEPDAIFHGPGEAERGLLVEAIGAHEIGHCWRYAHGAWHALPAGFVETGAGKAAGATASARAAAMRDARREEGYADLVALAWTAHRHPAHYAKVARWLQSVRAKQPVARGAHDTRAWVGLAREPGAFDPGGTPFDAAAALWRKGLLMGE
ncbi:MAG: hypothetical protein JWR40_280 [Massilia sp.]|jgi:hypothetical protein|nr:hypothetical protein [Massilia sp.]